jgi:hypothetical protein
VQNLIGVVKRRSSHAHINGALAIIKHRGLDGFKDRISQGLLVNVRSQLVRFHHETSTLLTKYKYRSVNHYAHHKQSTRISLTGKHHHRCLPHAER